MSVPLSRRIGASASFALAVAALSLLATQPALAKKSDRQQEMHIAAKHFDGFQKPNSVSTLRGSVLITQGTLKASGDEAKVYFDGNSQIARVVITGTPAHLQQLDDHDNLVQGQAATIDYDNLKGIAVLQGTASIKQQGRGQAHGDKLTYNTQTSKMTGESAGDGLVHMTFKPTTAPTSATTTAPAPASSTTQGQP